MKTVTVYTSSHATDEYGDSPSYSSFELTDVFLERLANVAALCKAHSLASCSEWHSIHWAGADDLRLRGDKLHFQDDSFYFSAYPKHCSYHVETPLIDIADMVSAFNSASDGDSLYRYISKEEVDCLNEEDADEEDKCV